jgi:excisionase family DNA binding protein
MEMNTQEEIFLRYIISDEIAKYFAKNSSIKSDLLTVSEAANYINISPRTIRRWIDENKIAFINLPGRNLRIKKQWLDGLLDKRTAKAKNT